MKICVVIPGFADGGAQKQCIFFINALKRVPGIRLSLIRAHNGVHDGLLESSGIEMSWIPYKSNYDLRSFVFVRREIARIKPDIVYSWLQSADLQVFVKRLLSRKFKWILAQRNSQHPSDWRFRLRRIAGCFTDAIVSNSEAGVRYGSGTPSKVRKIVISNILHPVRIEADRARTKEVLYLGRLEPQKNILAVARSFCALARRRPDLIFRIVGAGSQYDAVKDLIEQRGLQDRVILEGFHKNISGFLSTASVLVSLSSREGLPNTLIESISAGVPVVASLIPEHVELLGSNYPFFVSDWSDERSVSDSICEVISADQHEISRGLRFANARISRMTPHEVVSSYLRLFAQLLDGTGPRIDLMNADKEIGSEMCRKMMTDGMGDKGGTPVD